MVYAALIAILVFSCRLLWDYVDQQQRNRQRDREQRFAEFRRRRQSSKLPMNRHITDESNQQSP
jgi:hypothetical protein